MPKTFRLFLCKALIAAIPTVLLLGTYLLLDPFKVVRNYDSYYKNGVPSYVILNRDFVSTETFLVKNSVEHYDSFIFGNSRSLFYEVKEWQKHISSSRCFHFDASQESLYGIHSKICYLDRNGVNIQNAIIVLDASTLSQTTNSEGHLFRKDPKLSGESNWDFQRIYIGAFLDIKFIGAYLYFSLSGHYRESMMKQILDDRPMNYDLRSNEISFGAIETMIAKDPSSYYSGREKLFYPRSTDAKSSPSVIGIPQKNMLSNLASTLKRHNCNFKIVINPLYDQQAIAQEDLKYLKECFGRETVFDFSGINKFTQSYTNYYETSHYRPHVAREIMAIIYRDKN